MHNIMKIDQDLKSTFRHVLGCFGLKRQKSENRSSVPRRHLDELEPEVGEEMCEYPKNVSTRVWNAVDWRKELLAGSEVPRLVPPRTSSQSI